MRDSILVTIKKMLGIDEDYDAFDTDIITLINTSLMSAYQFGIGKKLIINDERETWRDFLDENDAVLGSVQSYIYSKVKMAFDPPSSSVAAEALKDLASECSWRLNLAYEEVEK